MWMLMRDKMYKSYFCFGLFRFSLFFIHVLCSIDLENKVRFFCVCVCGFFFVLFFVFVFLHLRWCHELASSTIDMNKISFKVAFLHLLQICASEFEQYFVFKYMSICYVYSNFKVVKYWIARLIGILMGH